VDSSFLKHYSADREGCQGGSHPLRLTTFASSPKGTPFGGDGKVSGIAQRRPLGGAGTAQAVTEGVRSSPTREKGFQENPQTFLKPKIKNILSADDAQSKAERIQIVF